MRLGELDLPDRFAQRVPRAATMFLTALVCCVLAYTTRWLVDRVMPGAGPFSLTLPFVLIASLFARWQSGLLTEILCAVFVWYHVLPYPDSFAFELPSDGPRVAANVIAGLMIVALAEVFRGAVRRAAAERDEALARRDLYLQELDHRVKNNFAMVSSLLDMQRRQFPKGDPAAEALSTAALRIESIARAHRSLYRGSDLPTMVAMRPYLQELCTALTDSLSLSRGIEVVCDAEDIHLPRDRAITIGLLVNELATNAAKHAFPELGEGRIEIRMHGNADGNICLIVADDGCGMDGAEARPGSLGQKLITAFAAQAGGTLRRDETVPGTRFVLELSAAD